MSVHTEDYQPMQSFKRRMWGIAVAVVLILAVILVGGLFRYPEVLDENLTNLFTVTVAVTAMLLAFVSWVETRKRGNSQVDEEVLAVLREIETHLRALREDEEERGCKDPERGEQP